MSVPQHTAVARVSESRLQASDSARARDLDWHMVFRDSHLLLLSTGDSYAFSCPQGTLTPEMIVLSVQALVPELNVRGSILFDLVARAAELAYARGVRAGSL